MYIHVDFCWHDSWKIHIRFEATTGKWMEGCEMRKLEQDLSENEPNLEECRTERVVNNISRCLIGNTKCKYALVATYAKAYCLHPKHGSFRIQQ